MDKGKKEPCKKSKLSLIGSGATLTVIIIVLIISSITLAWFTVNESAPTKGIILQSKKSHYDYKYYFDDELLTDNENGTLLIDIDWAVPGKIYKITIEVTNNVPTSEVQASYEISISNILGMLYDFDEEHGDITDDEGYYDAKSEVFAFYKFVVADSYGCQLSSVFTKKFMYEYYKDFLKNDRYQDYFESGDIYYYATFGEINGLIGLFPQNEIVDDKTVTVITLFVVAESEIDIDSNIFQESIYEGRIETNPVEK